MLLSEEAAGILKHKERKAKSERKLAQMDAHLARVNDITAEVERHLKPLERKAKKARLHKGFLPRFANLKLALAESTICASCSRSGMPSLRQKKSFEASQQTFKKRSRASEYALDALQRQLHERSNRRTASISDIAAHEASFERLNSTAMLLREKRSSYLSEIERLTRFVEEARVRRGAAEHELAEAQEAAEKAKVESIESRKASWRFGDFPYTQRVNRRNDLT